MSKINVCKICVNRDICIVREDCIYWQAINQQPQLSDDVEEALESLNIIRQRYQKMYLDMSTTIDENGQVPCYDQPFLGFETIKQHIQAQASEIEGLKNNCITVSSDEIIEQSTLESFYNQECSKNRKLQEKLNAIREVLKELNPRNNNDWFNYVFLGKYWIKIIELSKEHNKDGK